MLVNDRSGGKAGRVRGAHAIKGVMGRRDTAKDQAPSPGAAARTLGSRSPSPARTRTGPGRDAAALYLRRRHKRYTRPA